MSIVPSTHRLGLIRDTRGLSTVEYVILLTLIAAFAVFTWQTFGGNVRTYLSTSNDKIVKELQKE